VELVSLLRVYAPEECGSDDYPFAWAHETQADDQSNRYAGDGPRLEPPIKEYVRYQADNRCERCGHPYLVGEHGSGEWSPCDEHCTHAGEVRTLYTFGAGRIWQQYEIPPPRYTGRRTEARWRILTVHHLTGDKADCRWWNLAALCQRCHLTIQGRVVMERAFILEHSEWMKPHAAGFYAVKYCDQDLTREETMAQLDDLLAWERLA
jgi:hypothetical protein